MFDGAGQTTDDGIVLLCVVRPVSAILTKKIRRTPSGWEVFGDYDLVSRVRAKEFPVSSIETLAAILAEAGHLRPVQFATRGRSKPPPLAAGTEPLGEANCH